MLIQQLVFTFLSRTVPSTEQHSDMIFEIVDLLILNECIKDIILSPEVKF